MLKDITLGQYYQTESRIHALDPRTKIVLTFLYIISLFLFDNFIGYGIAFVFLATAIVMSHVPLRFMLRGLKTIFFLLLITLIFNLFMTPGEELICVWKLTITREGLRSASMMGLRLFFLIVGSSIMTLTTTPSQLTDGLERLMKPLTVFHAPVHEVAMMMSIALRFIPILVEELDKIMKAQISRGADFETGNIFKKAKGMVPLLVPLFVSAFRRANDLAMAMEVRCYRGGNGRTKLHPLKYRGGDIAAYILALIYVIGGKVLLVFLKLKFGIDF